MASLRLHSIIAIGLAFSYSVACGNDADESLPLATGGAGGAGGATGSGGTATGGVPTTGGLPGGSGGGINAGGGPVTTGGVPGGTGGTTNGGAGGDPGTGGTATGGTTGNGTWPPASDFAAKGTFATTTGPEGPDCTTFRPSTLGEGGLKHPIVVWGNGTTNTPANYTELFNHWASHGFVVIAANTSNAGSGREMIACLDYITKQNDTAGTYQGKLDVTHIASAGYSQGGAGSLAAGLDPRFTVTAPVAPYVVFPLGGYDTTSASKQTKPMFMLSGTADSVAEPTANQQVIFDQAKVPIVWATRDGATHFEVLGNGGNFRGPLTAWFRYKLMGDQSAGDWFKKTPCTLCTTAGWSVKHSALWQD